MSVASASIEMDHESICSQTSRKNSVTKSPTSGRRSSKASSKDSRRPSTEVPEVLSQPCELTPRQRKLRIAKSLITGCLKSCSSSFGLLIAVVMYAIMGGYIFYILEAENVITDCQTRRYQYVIKESKFINTLIDVTNAADPETMGESYMKLLRRFRKTLYEVDYTGDVCEMIGKDGGVNNPWSVSGAAMFAVTITSTIGYGHIAPKTFWGKMVCIAYALIGIPLMLLFLANVGDVLADFFRWFYARICCCGCCQRKPDPTTEDADGVSNNAFETDDDFQDKASVAPASSASLGSTPENEPSVAPRTGVNSSDMPTDDDNVSVTPSTAGSLAESVAIPVAVGSPSISPEPPARGPVLVEDDEEDEVDNVTIPLTITLGVLFGYILLGAVLFKMWENWEMGDAAYFSFVTLSTIGFGDFVPGQDGWNDPKAQINLILGAVYMVFGMAILSMCFTLIQDELQAKFTWIGKKLGLL